MPKGQNIIYSLLVLSYLTVLVTIIQFISCNQGGNILIFETPLPQDIAHNSGEGNDNAKRGYEFSDLQDAVSMDESASTALRSSSRQYLGPRRTKAHICYSRVHAEIMTKLLHQDLGFTDVDATQTDDWDLIVGGYPHCGVGPRYEGNRYGWDWDMEYGLNRILNERGWENLMPHQVYHPCMGCAATYCNKRELCRILRDHVDPSYCYVLPDDLNRLKDAMSTDKSKVWVMKKDAANVHIHVGRGVSFFSSLDELPSKEELSNGMYLVQPWNEPFLGPGIFHRKSEMRAYVAITSVYPLRAYVHEEMSVVLAAKEYTNSSEAMVDRCMADTHSSTTGCESFISREAQRVLRNLQFMNRAIYFHDYAEAVGWSNEQIAGLIKETHETISKVVQVGHEALKSHHINRGIQSSGASCFSWMRVDIGITKDLKPFLFEFPEFFANYGTNTNAANTIRDLYKMIGLDQSPLPPEERSKFESQNLGGWQLLPNLDH